MLLSLSRRQGWVWGMVLTRFLGGRGLRVPCNPSLSCYHSSVLGQVSTAKWAKMKKPDSPGNQNQEPESTAAWLPKPGQIPPPPPTLSSEPSSQGVGVGQQGAHSHPQPFHSSNQEQTLYSPGALPYSKYPLSTFMGQLNFTAAGWLTTVPTFLNGSVYDKSTVPSL